MEFQASPTMYFKCIFLCLTTPHAPDETFRGRPFNYVSHTITTELRPQCFHQVRGNVVCDTAPWQVFAFVWCLVRDPQEPPFGTIFEAAMRTSSAYRTMKWSQKPPRL